MKKNYEEPNLAVKLFEIESIMALSGVDNTDTGVDNVDDGDDAL